MPSELIRMLQLDYLYPPFLEALLSAVAECKMLGYPYKCYSGFRSTDAQRILHEAYIAGGPRAAPAGLSAHNYGLAIDCALLLPTGKLSWAEKDYEMLLKILPKHGLLSGKAFKDLPHVQWPGYVTGKQLLPLKSMYNAATGSELVKLKAVWQKIDTGVEKT